MSSGDTNKPKNPFKFSHGARTVSGASKTETKAVDGKSGRSYGQPKSAPPPPPPPRLGSERLAVPQRNDRPSGNLGQSGNKSAELLLPQKLKSLRDCSSKSAASSKEQLNTSSLSPTNSRRPSSDSDTAGPFADFFYDSTTSSSNTLSQEGDVNTQTVSEKYNIMPSAALLLFPEETERDDWLHNPVPGEIEPRECDVFSRRGVINIGSLVFLTVGMLLLFIGYPIATFVNNTEFPHGTSCQIDPNCIRSDLPLLQNIRQGLIDSDTPNDAKTRTSRDGSTQYLVFSDEFNKPGRTFYEGDDAYFQGVDLWYGATYDLEWYDPDAITTANGTLVIQFDQFENHGLNYRSGMLQSWNQMCFKGGYIEASISLPGNGQTIGFWPGFWTMGNLGRPGYQSTTDGMWPYSYWDKCDYGITANQSSPDGISWLPGMKLPACTCPEENHPAPGKSRSAPEIDALEASVGFLEPPAQAGIGTASQSYQLAPFDIWYQPNYDFAEVYDQSITTMNPYRGGSLQQAFSALTNLNNDWYDNKAYQKYGFEYAPGESGYCTWFVGNDPSWSLDARAMAPNGNVGQRVLPEEPLAVVANLGMSLNFAAINVTGIAKLLPGIMRIDYIRIYQGSEGVITCDPEGYPTTEYIAQHPKSYQDAQKITWTSAGYSWPRNSFVQGCDY